MTKVFISAGTPANGTQQAFRDAVINAVELVGLSPRLMDSEDWDYRNPLRGVRRVLDECRGALVIAYARYQFPGGLELRKDGNRELEQIEFPTAWNQIEAAMAYEKGLPLLVVAQRGLREDALLESTSDIQPFWCELDPAVDRMDGFKGYLRSWKNDVDAHESSRREALRKAASTVDLTVPQLVAALPWHQVLGFTTTLLALLAAAATFGYRYGKGSWPLG